MSLWLINALLVAFVILVLLKPLLGNRSKRVGETPAGDKRERHRLALLNDRLAELGRERKAGLIDEAGYAQAKQETEAAYGATESDTGERVAPPRAPLMAVVAVLLVVTTAAVSYFYFSEGYRILLAEEHATSVLEEFEKTREVLMERITSNPQDHAARLLLARLSYRLGDFDAALAGYRVADDRGALKSLSEWMDYADALWRSGSAAQDFHTTARVLEMLEQSLNGEVNNQRALFLAGMLSFESQSYLSASEYWQRLLAATPEEETEVRAELQSLITRAQSEPVEATAEKPAEKPAQAPTPASAQESAQEEGSPEEPVEADSPAIIVNVSLAQAVQSRAQPAHTVFVYARALQGPPMPLAIARLQVADLPAVVRLDESSAMMPGMSLAAFAEVEVVARVSASGQALPMAGDLIGTLSPVAAGSTVEVIISEIME